MNPSYCRIRLPKDEAIQRFSAWQRLSEIGPLVPTNNTEAIRLAVDDKGDWCGNAVFVSELGEWTLFQDLSGALGGIAAVSWAEFAGRTELVMAGYNDAIPYGEVVMMRDGSVIREFLDDRSAPESNVNRGLSDSQHEPFTTWVDVAGFVDADALGFCENGWLWVWPRYI